MPYCVNCGSEYLEGDYFCANCGFNVQEKPVASKPAIFFESKPSTVDVPAEPQVSTHRVEFAAPTSARRQRSCQRTHSSGGGSIVAIGCAFLFVAFILAAVFFVPILVLDNPGSFGSIFGEIGGAFGQIGGEIGHVFGELGGELGEVFGGFGSGIGEAVGGFFSSHHMSFNFRGLVFLFIIVFFFVPGIIMLISSAKHRNTDLS